METELNLTGNDRRILSKILKKNILSPWTSGSVGKLRTRATGVWQPEKFMPTRQCSTRHFRWFVFQRIIYIELNGAYIILYGVSQLGDQTSIVTVRTSKTLFSFWIRFATLIITYTSSRFRKRQILAIIFPP